MINAYATIRCDHPDCQASVELPDALRFGQLNPLQVTQLQDLACRVGWVGFWVEDRVVHYCRDHAPVSRP